MYRAQLIIISQNTIYHNLYIIISYRKRKRNCLWKCRLSNNSSKYIRREYDNPELVMFIFAQRSERTIFSLVPLNIYHF